MAGSKLKKQEESEMMSGPRVTSILQTGIKTAPDFAKCMSALMADIADESISPKLANAICNAGGKLLKVVEMQYKYGKPSSSESPRDHNLVLVPGDVVDTDEETFNKKK